MLVIDLDKSGTVNGEAELKKLMYYAGLPDDLGPMVFKHFDKNNDGHLSIPEMMTFLGVLKAYALVFYVYELWCGEFNTTLGE
jgi:hypothetical protein